MTCRIIGSMIIVFCFLFFSAGTIYANTIDKQKEIDQYIFETNSAEVAELGINVTHTAPLEDTVEIGITPYSEEAAAYFYEKFGKDTVTVVKGIQAVTYGEEVGSTNGVVEEGKDAGNPISAFQWEYLLLLVIVGGLVLGRIINLQNKKMG
ncbi:hypothetical protein ACLM5H_19975 [Fredinandcohnia humi]